MADVVAFLNDVEKKEEDAIAMLDDLIEEDKLKKQASGENVAPTEAPAAPVAPVPPVDDGPRDLVSMLEKIQQLIEVHLSTSLCRLTRP